jgi:hypothetical protein
MSFEKGVRTSTRENTYTAWTTFVRPGSGGAPSNVYGYCRVPFAYADFSTQLETYESLTGISQDVTTLSIQAKWFETGNTRAWAGGIKTVNAAGSTVYHGDRIMYTPPGKYDTWPPENYIDVGKQNGKPCKAGRIYADRLLDFREDILYIINVAQGADTAWYLESEHPGLGVKTPGATFACDIGILWANRNGCYWYDGERVNNLLEEVQDGKLVRTLSRSAWKTFVTDNAVVGYDPQRRQVVVLNDASQTQNTTTYIFDMATRTWAYGTRFSRNIGTGSFTNFAIYDNELVIGDYRG